MRPTLLIATTNAGKIREFSDLLADQPVQVKALTDFPGEPFVSEEGATYAANAVHKAVTIARWSRCATLADDSGLEVDALAGAPGVRSARYAGVQQDSQANIGKLLRELSDVPAGGRTARFRCAIAVACPDGATLTGEGICEGRIIEEPRGIGGFGYDPVFLDPASGLTFAELPAVLKNHISHRARAYAALRSQLLRFLSVHGPEFKG